MADNPDMESGGSHQSSTKTLEATACIGNMLNKLAYVNLNDDLLAGSKHKPVVWRVEQREGGSLHTITSMVVDNTMEGRVMADTQF